MSKVDKKAGGESHRLARVEKEIRDVVGTYLATGSFRGQLPGLVSITRIRVSADLKIANLNFTMILPQNEGETPEALAKREVGERANAVKELNAHAHEIQDELAHKLRMRFTPRVTFHYDENFESALKIERLLNEMATKKPPQTD